MTAGARRPGPRRRTSRAAVRRLHLRSRGGGRWWAYLRTGWLPSAHHRTPAVTPQPPVRPLRQSAARRSGPVVLAPGLPSVLTSRTTWDVASKLNRAFAPVAVTLDAARLGVAARRDRGIGRNVARTGASIAGSWAGGYAGGVAGSHTGAVLGAVAGPVGALVGGLTGGLVGAVAGAVGLAKVSEEGVDLAASVHDSRLNRASRQQRRRHTAVRSRQHNCLRRAWFRDLAKVFTSGAGGASPDGHVFGPAGWVTVDAPQQRTPSTQTAAKRSRGTSTNCAVS